MMRLMIIGGLLVFLSLVAGAGEQPPSTAPEIVYLGFPKEIKADGNPVSGTIAFKDIDGDIIRADFVVVRATNFPPFSIDPKVKGIKKGEFQFQLSTTTLQQVTLWAVLIDEAGHKSNPWEFSFEAMRSLPAVFLMQWGSHGSNIGEFRTVTDIASDNDGNLYVADFLNHRIQKFDANGQFLDTWGSCGSQLGQFRGPMGVAVSSQGKVYIADTENHRIQVFDPSRFKPNEKLPTLVWGSRCLLRTGNGCRDPDGGGPLVPGDGQFDGPTDVVVDPTGNIYVVDSGNHRIQKFDSTGKFLGKWGTRGSAPGQFETPISIALDSTGKFAYVTDKGNHRIQKFDVSRSPLQFVAQWGSECNLTVTPPTGRCVDSDGTGQFFEPQGIAVDDAGNVYVADTGNHRIQKFDVNGKFLAKWGTEGRGPGQFELPRGITIFQDFIYIADLGNDRVQKFTLR